MKLKNFKITNKGLYWGLIATFALLYLFVGFVSTLHSITFFNLANTMSLAILLGVTYEIGQASVLFSILMTKNKDKFLPWALMFLLTALQVTANVYASFKHMVNSGSDDWVYWQKSILFGVQAQNTEMYQVIISWIAGALLPIVALGMTALVAQNMKLMTEEEEEKPKKIENEEEKETVMPIVADLKKPSEYVNFDEIKAWDKAMTSDEPQKTTEYLDEEAEQLTPEYSATQNDYYETQSKELIKDINKEVLTNIIKPDKKKQGRPPKQKDKAVVSKKEQELLQKEEVRVPQKRRIVNPLKRKSKRIKPLKNLKEISKPSKGEEVIALIETLEKDKVKDTITQPIEDIEKTQESLLVPPEILTPYLDEFGVEVLDVKAIPKDENIKKN